VSISPVSDIVLDVIKAADPVTSKAAIERLSRLSEGSKAQATGFDHVFSSFSLRPSEHPPVRDGTHTRSTGPAPDARTKAYKGLEQLVLRTLIDTVLPKDTSGFFGNGSAGNIYRSFLTDELAAVMSRSVDLHITNRKAAMASHETSQPQASGNQLR
jgi:hypothetical protein